ncbi:hypothetical protein ACAG25_04115 [Mycobacterium sp. pV006]|uniref:hypothetical protein n=1 Tax=Mycobacterium sp. pV006 TaxID=3238983 RepID=UPI00351BD8A0
MFTGVRSCLAVSTGAVMIAGGLHLAPPTVAPPPTVPAAVQLTAVPSPLELYPRVFGTALQGAAELVRAYAADPLPIVRAVVGNQLVALADAADALRAGNGAAFLDALGDAIAEPLQIPAAVRSALGRIPVAPYIAEGIAVSVLGPLLSGVSATVTAFTDVVTSALRFDLVGVVEAVLNIPGRVIDGVLNGGYRVRAFGLDTVGGGLLTPLTREDRLPGPLSLGIQFDQWVGEAIPVRPRSAPAEEPADTAGLSVDTVAAPVVDTDDEPPARIAVDEQVTDATETARTRSDKQVREKRTRTDRPRDGRTDRSAASAKRPARSGSATGR